MRRFAIDVAMTSLNVSMFFFSAQMLAICRASKRCGMSRLIVRMELCSFWNCSSICFISDRLHASLGFRVSTAVRVRSAASFRPTPMDDIRNADRMVKDLDSWLAPPFMIRPRVSDDD